MKNFIFLLFIVHCSLFTLNSSAQTSTFRITGNQTRIFNIDGTPNELLLENSTKTKNGAYLKNTLNGKTDFSFVVDSMRLSNDTLFFRHGTMKFIKLPSTSSSGSVTIDTLPLSERITENRNMIATKLATSDTASMLSNYRHWLEGYLKAADIAGKLSISDTASMLLNYRHWLSGYLKSPDIAGKLNITDTTAMLSNYKHWTEGYLKAVDISGKADKATTITINGVTYDLSTNRSWTVAGGTGGSGLQKVYAGSRLANTNDSTLNADSLAANLRAETALKKNNIDSLRTVADHYVRQDRYSPLPQLVNTAVSQYVPIRIFATPVHRQNQHVLYRRVL